MLDNPILEAWEATRARNRDLAAIVNADGKVVRTFSQIEERAGHFARQLETIGPGKVIAVQIGNHRDWPSLFLACLRKQVVVLPLEQTISEEQKRNAFQMCRVGALASLSSRAESRDPADLTLKITHRDPSTFARDDRAMVAAKLIDWQGHAPSLLKLTSGTTAAPRAVRFRSEQLLADCEQICETMGISDVDVNFGVIPVSHSYGFSNLLTPLIARGVAMVLSQDRTPPAVLDDLAKTNATVFPGTPVFYQAFCELKNIPPVPKLRLCVSAGAPLPLPVAKKFREKSELPIHSFYGASECGGICYDREANDEIEGFVGAPI